MTGLEDQRIEVGVAVLLDALEALRLAPAYALLHVAPEEICEDFRPEKWQGSEREFAQDCLAAYHALLAQACEARGIELLRE